MFRILVTTQNPISEDKVLPTSPGVGTHLPCIHLTSALHRPGLKSMPSSWAPCGHGRTLEDQLLENALSWKRVNEGPLGNPSLCPNQEHGRSWSWKVLWRPTRPFRTNTQKRHPFHYRGLERKTRKSRNTWSNRQIWPWHTEWKRLIDFCQENALFIAITLFQQHKRRLYTWISPDSQHWIQIDYILCSQSWRSCIQSAKTRLGADCGSDHELLIAEVRLKLKKVGKTTGPFRYDLNKIPYNYTVEVRNRFMELDLIEKLMNYGWRFRTLYRRQ